MKRREIVNLLDSSVFFLCVLRISMNMIDSLDRAYDSVARELHSALDTVVAVPVKYATRMHVLLIVMIL